MIKHVDTLTNTVLRGARGKKLFFGTCGSSAATTDKVIADVEITSDDIHEGFLLVVSFYNGNSAVSTNLLVNGITFEVNPMFLPGALEDGGVGTYWCQEYTAVPVSTYLVGCDTEPVANGTRPVTSGALYTACSVLSTNIAALENKLPDPPTTDGTYTLTVTVSSGQPTYSWE